MNDDAAGVFGIDLGTTYSAIACIDEFGKPVVIANAMEGTDTTPSVVHFESASNIVVGQTAKETAKLDAEHVVSMVKREMGHADWSREFHDNRYTAPAVSALILSALVKDAAMTTGRTVDQVVITAPAYFGTLERAATRQAGEIAGLTVLEIIPEPVAAAIAYGLATEPGERTILVYDLGGGTFDITLIRFMEDAVVSIVTDGDHDLGGADWDAVLFEHLVDTASTQVGSDDMRDDPHLMQEVWGQAEELKKRLSQSESRPVVVHTGGDSAKVTVARGEFEQMTAHLVQKTVDITRRALATAEAAEPGVTARIDDVILVGGSSLMPVIARTLRSEFGWVPKLSDPHLAVAKGAALYAAGALVRSLAWGDDADGGRAVDTEAAEQQLEQAAETIGEQIGVDPVRLLGIAQRSTTRNRLPKAIGVEFLDTSVTGWESMATLPTHVVHQVPAQTELPYDAQALGRMTPAATIVDGQDVVKVAVWEQASPEPGESLESNRPLASGEITQLAQYRLPKGSPIELYFSISNDGEISLQALEPTSGKRLEVKARIALLSEEEVAEAKAVFSGLTVSS